MVKPAEAWGVLISNIRFENIRIEETRKFIFLWIGKNKWSRDPEHGRIKSVIFQNIQAVAAPDFTVQLQGFDADHRVEDVLFQDVSVNGAPLPNDAVKNNSFVNNVVIRP